MKRQPIVSAAVFFDLFYEWVESGGEMGENGWERLCSTDEIF